MKKIDENGMRRGYVEMGFINLSISNESFEAENQAMRLGDAYNEMDSKESKGDSKQG